MPAHDWVPDERLAFVYVRFPGDLDPFVRHGQYGDPIDAELQLLGLGSVTGGGSCYSLGEEDGEDALFSGLDLDVTDVDATRELLRLHLPELGCPAGTLIEFTADGLLLADEFDGREWFLDKPRDPHPAFGV